MKRLLLTGALVLSMFLITGFAFAEEKFAYVDLSEVFQQYKKTKEYDKILEGKQKAYEEQREKKVDEVKKLQEKISLLSEEEKEGQKTNLEETITALQEFDRSSTQDLRKQRDEKVKEIFQDIDKAVETYAKKEGITLVFDRRALVLDNAKLDITEQILKIINK